MKSEKVKEIKKALEDNADREHYNSLWYMNNCKCITVAYADILTYINELESENERLLGVIDIANEREYRKKFNDEWRKEYQKELDKQGNGHIAGFPDFDLVYKLYFEQKDRIATLEKEMVKKIVLLLADYKEYEYESNSYKDWCVPHMIIKKLARWAGMDLSTLNNRPSEKPLVFNGVKIKE